LIRKILEVIGNPIGLWNAWRARRRVTQAGDQCYPHPYTLLALMHLQLLQLPAQPMDRTIAIDSKSTQNRISADNARRGKRALKVCHKH
jgi:hypothetical protein